MPIRIRSPTALLALGFTILGVLLAASLAFSDSQKGAYKWVTHTLEVENRVSILMATLQDVEATQRGFVVTGDARYLAAYTGAAGRVDKTVDDLAAATADNPVQRAAIARLRPLIDLRLQSLAKGVDLRRKMGLSQAAAFIAQGRGRLIMDEIRGQIAGMTAEEQQLLVKRKNQAARIALWLQVARVTGFLVLLLLATFGIQDSARRLAHAEGVRDELLQTNLRMMAEAEARAAAEAQLRQLQKMEAVGQLTGGIAHDFNNMLSVIVGSLDLARRRLRTQPERADVYIGNALEGAQRAASLTARLLAFSRQQPLAPIALDPNKLVGGMSEMLRRTIGEQVSVETVLGGGVWRVDCDPQQLENVVLNLCVNARDAMPNGGRLTIETSNAFLDDGYARDHDEVTSGQYVLISVSDTGMGMAPDVVQRAFDPFYTTKEVGKGTGLGLSQVYGFVKQSGGHVKIYSEPGQGTTVKVYLPRWMGAATDVGVASVPQEIPRAVQHEIVLVVEDDEKVRQVTVDTLCELGYDVVQASSGEDALQMLALQPHIDLLLTDIVMPGMSGRALAAKILDERPDLHVLYVTGYTPNAVVHNGVLDTGVAFLSKPFSTRQLALKVRQVLDGQGANRPA